jgi:hypothetical protein
MAALQLEYSLVERTIESDGRSNALADDVTYDRACDVRQ